MIKRTVNASEVVVKKRNNFLFVFMGRNRSGKSTLARRKILAWRQARDPNKYPIIGFQPPTGGTGTKIEDLFDYHIDIEDEEWAVKLAQKRNYLLVIDDLKVLTDSDRPPKGFKTLLYNRCNNNYDIIFIFHFPADVYNIICKLATHWFIFMMNPQDGEFKKKIPSYELCKAGGNKVRSYCRDLDFKKIYPRFPHVVVDVDKEMMQGYYFDHTVDKFLDIKR